MHPLLHGWRTIFMGGNMKVCCHCKRELDESRFGKKSDQKDGLRRECKDCVREYGKRYRTENREQYLEKRYEREKKNPDKIKEHRKRNYEKHREERIEYARNYRIENRDKYLETQRASEEKRKGKRKEYNRQYSINNREKINERQRKYRVENADHLRENARRYYSERREADDMFRLKQDLRNLVGVSFRNRGWGKLSKTQEMLGCTFEEAKQHLEETWCKNYGTEYNGEEVHIDHIVPLSTAKSPEEMEKLFHISNLQYLKPYDNMSKGCKLNWELEKE